MELDCPAKATTRLDRTVTGSMSAEDPHLSPIGKKDGPYQAPDGSSREDSFSRGEYGW